MTVWLCYSNVLVSEKSGGGAVFRTVTVCRRPWSGPPFAPALPHEVWSFGITNPLAARKQHRIRPKTPTNRRFDLTPQAASLPLPPRRGVLRFPGGCAALPFSQNTLNVSRAFPGRPPAEEKHPRQGCEAKKSGSARRPVKVIAVEKVSPALTGRERRYSSPALRVPP